MTLRLAWIAAACMLPFLTGCHKNNVATQQMQEELRFQEDRIYQLEDWIRQYNAQLSSCRDENTSLRGGKSATSSRSAPKAPVRVSPFGDSEPKAPEVPEVEIPKVEIPNLNAPPVELPAPKAPATNRGSQRTTPPGGTRVVRRHARPTAVAPNTHRARQVVVPESLPLLQPAHDAIAAAVAPLANTPATRLSSYEAAAPKDAAVAGITLNATLTAALNQNGQPGDDGLMVVVEPRNRAGELIPPAGSLSVSLLDPAATSEEEARVGRWDYSAEQTKQLYRRTTLGDGVQLNLLWQKGPPRHDRLELYVRLAMADGRKLHARRTILVTLPAATAVAEEPRRLEPEPVMPEPVLPLPKPVAAPTRPAPVPADPFQVIPLAPAPVAAAGVGPPTPIVAQPAIVQPPIPVAPAVPAVQPATRVAAVPRRPQPVRPPAEEQVAIPREPGDAPEPLTEPSVAPPPPKPQWAPFRD